MDYESYQPESWRSDDGVLRPSDADSAQALPKPDVHDRSLVLDLLGRINYQILSGHRVYIESSGKVYKALYGGYWRSVFTGIEHFTLKCQAVSGAVWCEDDPAASIDMPIEFSNKGWTARGHSLSFMLSQAHDADSMTTKSRWQHRLEYHRARYRERARAALLNF